MSSNKEDLGGSMNSDALISRFTDLCKVLAVSEDVITEAKSLLIECKSILLVSPFGSRPLEETEKYCFAYVLYCVLTLGKDSVKEESKEGRIRLSDILKASKLKLDEFFKEAQQFSIKAKGILGNRYDFDWEDRLELKQLEKIVRMLSDASKFYDKAYKDLFTFANTSEISEEIHRFGWLLFLTLRVDTPDLFKDLVSCVHGLVAVLAILILHVPVKFRNFSPQDSSRFVKRSEKGIDLLASLCHTYHTFEECLRGMVEKSHKIIQTTLSKKPTLASECKSQLMLHINTDGLMHFNELIQEGLMKPHIQALEKHYVDSVGKKGEIDEMLFIHYESGLLNKEKSHNNNNPPSSIYDSKTLTSPTKMITNTLTLPLSPNPKSPIRPNFISNPKFLQMTPVTSAMTSAKWLREVISPLPDHPSPQLEHFLSLENSKTLTPDLTRRAHIILEAIFHNGNSFDASWARERKSEACKLYYRVLESICKSESTKNNINNTNNNDNNKNNDNNNNDNHKTNNNNNLRQLLMNERFHRCMLACSAELVLATHKTVIMMFPAVLEASGLTPFDLSKVIETFIRHEETLPRELKRHLNSLEEQLLESLVWSGGSSLYNSLVVFRGEVREEVARLGLLAEPMRSLDEIATLHGVNVNSKKREASPDGSEARSPKRVCIEPGNGFLERNCFTPPAKERLLSLKSKFHPLQSTFASPGQPNPVGGNETCAEVGCKVLFSKILKLGAIRIRSLCERLRQPQQILDRVYGIFQNILDKRTHLFFNRHVDQIILCCFYGVAKVSRLTLTFKEIVSIYKKEPQCKPEVFRNVFVSNGNGRQGVSHVDIITFYNEVFVPAVKPFLVNMVPASNQSNDKSISEGQIPGSPKVSPFKNLPDMSPKKVSASHNVYVSPLRQSKMDALLSPSSRSYYACIGESTHAFQSPSKDLDAINNRLNNGGTGRRISGRINFDMVSDSVVAGSLGYQNGNSGSSEPGFGFPVKRERSDS